MGKKSQSYCTIEIQQFQKRWAWISRFWWQVSKKQGILTLETSCQRSSPSQRCFHGPGLRDALKILYVENKGKGRVCGRRDIQVFQRLHYVHADTLDQSIALLECVWPSSFLQSTWIIALWHPLVTDSRIPTDSTFCRCSSPLYKMVWHLPVT